MSAPISRASRQARRPFSRFSSSVPQGSSCRSAMFSIRRSFSMGHSSSMRQRRSHCSHDSTPAEEKQSALFGGQAAMKKAARAAQGARVSGSRSSSNQNPRKSSAFAGRKNTAQSPRLWTQAANSCSLWRALRTLPSTRRVSFATLPRRAAAVLPRPLPPEVANSTTVLPEKS